jgi:nitroreductase
MAAPVSTHPLFDGPAAKFEPVPSEVHELIRARWSPRSYSPQDVPDQDLRTVLEAAEWAASSNNEQPWRFLIARKSADQAAFEKFLHLLVEGNQLWAHSAPILIIMAAKRTFTNSNSPNYYALHDTGAALANFMLQATALGLHAHGMAGFDHQRARQELAIPDDYEIAAAVALGYRDSPDKLSEKHVKSELAARQRKPLSEIAFGASWQQPLNLQTS